MKCWICGSEAKTGEHLVKHSDLRMLFGKATTQIPLYFNRDNKPIKMQSTNSSLAKGTAKICSACNNSRTQPHDKSWEVMSIYLQANLSKIKSNGFIKLKNVFPGSKSKDMLNIHLYFNKLFGTRLAAEKTPLGVESFRNAILGEVENPNLYIAFGYWPASRKTAGITKIHALELNGMPATVYWFYVINKVAVCLNYCTVPEVERLTRNSWKPSNIKAKVKYVEFPT